MKTRILSGIVLVIIMASALVCGSWYLFGLNLMIALIGMFELYRVIHMEKTVMAYAGYIACILYYICIGAGRDEYLLLVLAAEIAYRRAIKMAIANTMRSGAEGIKILISGRLNGAEMARSEMYKEGRTPLHTFRADIDYCQAEALTKVGLLGIKVWICRGEVYGKRDLAPNFAQTKENSRGGNGGKNFRKKKNINR